MAEKIAIIIGAGPAGLTAAYELIKKTDIKPIIFEENNQVGGIAKTINYKGNRMDIGGHRFFSKSDEVMQWWKNILPLEKSNDSASGLIADENDKVMLVRNRVSRIYFLKKFFDYPISLSFSTLINLGFFKVFKIVLSYIKIRIFPLKPEKSLQDFFVNRFGSELYRIFFKDYTEKVWGVPCDKIKAEWGAQRVKGLSIGKAISHFFKSLFLRNKSIGQKETETSLIEKFLYPKFGPGQMWQSVLEIIEKKGGQINLSCKVIGINSQNDRITEVKVKNEVSGQISVHKAEYFFSSMPVKDLISSFSASVPHDVREVSENLFYRDFITVGLLLNKLKIKSPNGKSFISDNWIYIQEREVKLGRLQIFNNWSPYLVKENDKVWIGLEYFCNQGDELWKKSDQDFIDFAILELVKIGFIYEEDVIDSTMIRVPKAYPAYFGSYDNFHIIRNFIDDFSNLFLIGRNGMHRYNNMDHSMLTAILAVQNILKNIKTKDNIWNINNDNEYHEAKA